MALNSSADQTEAAERSEPRGRILVCGATGYVGGRLVPRLLERGWQVRCLVRSPEKLDAFPWRNDPALEIQHGDLSDAEATRRACQDIDAAYYLVHAMLSAGSDYAERDRQLASGFAKVARETGVGRIIYLGGLGELGPDLSIHLQSRREVAGILRDSGVPTFVLRAAMIIGSGSASFEILRYLVERLPIMVTPKWVKTETQPIAIRDVLRYLVDCLDVPASEAGVFDIGGTDVLTYQQMMVMMAEAIELPRRVIIPVPVLTPKLSSLWISLVTPVNSQIARPLAEGLKNRTVCRNDRAQQFMPGPLLSAHEALDAALGKLASGDIETRWSTAGEMPGDPEWAGGTTLQDQRETLVAASPQQAFAAICRIGGRHGYWGADYLWWIRGWMDKLVGGPGLRRGRRHPQNLRYGEAVDFWRVSGYQHDELLKLRAEMKLPGVAELSFRIETRKDGDAPSDQCRVIQTARFRPKGLTGLAYWYSVLPLHSFVFPRMLRGIRREAELIAHSQSDTNTMSPSTESRVPEQPPKVSSGPARGDN